MTKRLLIAINTALIGLTLAMNTQAASTDISTVPLNTYSAAGSTDVKPNVFFIIDDSGSMDWDFMPDWACSNKSLRNSSCASVGESPNSTRHEYLFRDAAYNGVYYNPAVTYKPPLAMTAGGLVDLTKYLSMTGVSTGRGGDGSASVASPNWKAVKNDAYHVQSLSTTTTDLESSTSHPPYFYTIIPGEYCTAPTLKNCVTATASSATHPYPAYVRWCTDSGLGTCQAAFSPSYKWVRSPEPRTSTLTISSVSTGAKMTSIIVNGKEILPVAVTAGSTSTTNMAAAIAAQINNCNGTATGACGVAGYAATSNSNVITITAGLDGVSTPSVSKTGTLNSSTTAFNSSANPGYSVMTYIVPGTTQVYPFPGRTARADERVDCAGTKCTGNEEMTNYANWWTYYKSRMQMMKSSASHAFAAIDTTENIDIGVSRFRLGYMSLNKNASQDFLNMGEFKGTHKFDWYDKLFNANPNSGTPLRDVLATAGLFYAGKLNGSTIDGVTVEDPMQYSCQQNYTILSTDGFWNGGAGFKLNGSTSVGNQDGYLNAPYSDGANQTIKTRTSTLRERAINIQVQKKEGTLQKSEYTDVPAPPDLRQTRASSGSSWTNWEEVASCTVKTSGWPRTNCRYPTATSSNYGTTWTDWTYLGTNASCNKDTSSSSRRACDGTIPSWSAWTDAASCSVNSTTQCQYNWTGWTNVASCSAVAESTSSPYTVASPRQCQSIVGSYGAWSNASTCTPSSTKECAYTGWTSWTTVPSCTAVAQSSPAPGDPYTVATAVQCDLTISGGTSDTLADVAAYYYSTDLRSSVVADGTGTCTGPIIAPATTANDLCEDNVEGGGRDVAKHQHMTTFTLGLGAQGLMAAPTPGKDYWNDESGDFYDVKNQTTANPSAGICSWQTAGTVCTWPAPTSNLSTTIDDLWHAAINGRGTYFSATSPDTLSKGLVDALAKISNTPRPGTAAAAASSNPNVSSNDNYVFSSSYKSVEWYGELIRQRITDTGNLTAQNWSAMKLLDCATTPWTANVAYAKGSIYTQGGKCYLVKEDYNAATTFDGTPAGVDGSKTELVNKDETANVKVPVAPLASRTLYTTDGNNLIPFTWSSLQTATLDGYFKKPHISYVSDTQGLSQFCPVGVTCLSAGDQTSAAGEELVKFLRGERSKEGNYYRKRIHVLGDIVSSEGRYVQTPLFNYNDDNYDKYKTLHTTRKGVVYVGANDGFVHAFEAETGQELWAYAPSMILPEMYKLADAKYGVDENHPHQFYVDGTPETGDFCPKAPTTTCTAAQWKTILVGGLNRGGKGYYALDVTNPDVPKLLWEFTDPNLGYSYGNPRITKLKDGTWVVLLSSGYNNADGDGRLYVIRARDGFLIRTIKTGAGSIATPSGLARISANAKTPMTDNTTVAAYGGDVLGNLWRFDINNDIGSSTVPYEAHKLATFTDGTKVQPVTVKPLEATVYGKPVVFVGTGRFLGKTDIDDTQQQTFYAIKDKLDDTTYGDIRAVGSKFIKQTLTTKDCPTGTPASVCESLQKVRTSSNNTVSWATDNGWYMDYIGKGERSNTDPTLGLGALLFTTNSPSAATANACGKGDDTSASYLYQLDYLTGGALDGYNGVVGINLGSGLVTRPVLIKLADGSVRALIRKASTSLDDGTDMGKTDVRTVTPPNGKASEVRRVSWRELPTE